MHHALQILRAVEGLLLLEEVNIADNWDTANGPAVLCVGKRNALIVGKVRRGVRADPALYNARDFGDDIHWSLVRRHHVVHAICSRLAALQGPADVCHCLHLDNSDEVR